MRLILTESNWTSSSSRGRVPQHSKTLQLLVVDNLDKSYLLIEWGAPWVRIAIVAWVSIVVVRSFFRIRMKLKAWMKCMWTKSWNLYLSSICGYIILAYRFVAHDQNMWLNWFKNRDGLAPGWFELATVWCYPHAGEPAYIFLAPKYDFFATF